MDTGDDEQLRDSSRLLAELDVPLPESVIVGGGTAVFVCGWAYAPGTTIERLVLLVGEEEQPIEAHSMPRLDVVRARHPRSDPRNLHRLNYDPSSPEDPYLHSYRSGFWGFARLGPRNTGPTVSLSLRAHTTSGSKRVAHLGSLALAELPEPLSFSAPTPGSGDLVAICMATHEPPDALFRAQLDSIRSQTHPNWVCVISDDASSEEGLQRIRDTIGEDDRFLLSPGEERVGFYKNFERALALAPSDAKFIALSDQDDCWHEDKLATLLEAIGDAQLCYSDARIIKEDGTQISPSFWTERANNSSNFTSLLVANSVTGAASLFPRELLKAALPFPPDQFAHFHDHWLALVALSRGRIEYVDQALYDYVQHGSATLGHLAATTTDSLTDRIQRANLDLRERIRRWRFHYYIDVMRLAQFALTLGVRDVARTNPEKRRIISRWSSTNRSAVDVVWLMARGIADAIGSQPTTLGAEWMLGQALAWRKLLQASARRRPFPTGRIDAVPPPVLAPAPGRKRGNSYTEAIEQKVAELHLDVRADVEPRVNLLVPTIDLQHFFGGYIAKFNLASRLASEGLNVRIVTTDPVPRLPSDWREQIEHFEGLSGVFRKCDVVFGREGRLEVSPLDRFIATTWWTALIAAKAIQQVEAESFLYLIQEYEPFTFPMGTYAALATSSYEEPHQALFSSELLREYFRENRIGVYRDGSAPGDRASLSFQNAITKVGPPSLDEMARRSSRRLVFYARPEPHAQRNLFELGLVALSRASRDGILQGWEVLGIGSASKLAPITLDGGHQLKLIPRTSQHDYARVLQECDLGLSLMYTPHPSLVPIEMASAGIVTVTNTFANKTPKALKDISTNLVAATPSSDGIVSAIKYATDRVGDLQGRMDGSHVSWSRDWHTSLDAQVMAWVRDSLHKGPSTG